MMSMSGRGQTAINMHAQAHLLQGGMGGAVGGWDGARTSQLATLPQHPSNSCYMQARMQHIDQPSNCASSLTAIYAG